MIAEKARGEPAFRRRLAALHARIAGHEHALRVSEARVRRTQASTAQLLERRRRAAGELAAMLGAVALGARRACI